MTLNVGVINLRFIANLKKREGEFGDISNFSSFTISVFCKMEKKCNFSFLFYKRI
jgi:hypothetical protein